MISRTLAGLIAASILILDGCGSENQIQPHPDITSFTPALGIAGETVILTGTNFSTTPNENVVKFNGTIAVVTGATAIQLTTTVPAGATSGNVSVTVNGQTAISRQHFTVLHVPTITSFNPARALPGASVTITGTNFSDIIANNTVEFNNVSASITSATSTTLTVTVPDGSTTGKISVTTGGNKATSADNFEVLIDIPRDGLVAFYPFTGNANDVSGNNLHGTTRGGPTPDVDRYGHTGSAYKFDGTDDYITLGNPSQLQISNTITLSGWINIRAFRTPPAPGVNYMTVIEKMYTSGSVSKGYTLEQDFYGNGMPSMSTAIYSSDDSGTITSFLSSYVGGAVITHEWMFFCFVIDGDSYKYYRNGTLAKEISASGTTILADGARGDLVVGNNGTNHYFDGWIDDIAIYNRALPADEVMQLYRQSISQ